MRKLLLPLVALVLAACSTRPVEADYHVVPLPQTIELTDGQMPFVISPRTLITFPTASEELQSCAALLADYVMQSTGYALTQRPDAADKEGVIALELNAEVSEPEGFRISITPQRVLVEGTSAAGVFYGLQTLRKSFPAVSYGERLSLPAATVAGSPRFAYRGMHLDVSRHFFPLSFLKEYVDLLALHQMNTLHLHLTDNQGWRMEIDRYPALTATDTTAAGGYYTRSELRELVEYARARFVSIIPEIDQPGHMKAALRAYPGLACKHLAAASASEQDTGDVLCVGSEQTFEFIERVLDEVIDVFPSEYIHIGGDEVPRDRWHRCPLCQARIRAEHLRSDSRHSAEDRLQSYCMARVERYLRSKGRKAICWDEVMDGDVSPTVAVMSWRGTEGGIEAARTGHDVVMTPAPYCYFDYYQSANTDSEPLAIGGYLPVEKVYGFDPTASLSPDEARRVRGVQANLWTEFVATPAHAEYMVLPRMAALAEVQWCRPEQRNYSDFARRVMRLMNQYDRDGYHYARHLYEVTASFTPDSLSFARQGSTVAADTARRCQYLTLSTVDDAPIRYTTDGADPTAASPLYQAPIPLSATTEVRAAAFRPSGRSQVLSRKVEFNKATLRPVALTATQPHPKYTFGGAQTLVDGCRGKLNYAGGEWLGFLGDVTAVVDLQSLQTVSSVSVTALTYMDAWIVNPIELSVELSVDGTTYQSAARQTFAAETNMTRRDILPYTTTFAATTARYVRITLKRPPVMPAEHPGAGDPAFLFIDEIAVE